MPYSIPAFRIETQRRSRTVFGHAVMTAHLGLHFFGGDLVAEFSGDLADFSTDKGTIRFSADHPIPRALLNRLPARRMQQLGAGLPA